MTYSFINLSQTMARRPLVARLNVFNLLQRIGHICFQPGDTVSAYSSNDDRKINRLMNERLVYRQKAN